MATPKKKDQRISEGIILALATAAVYLFAFFYEKGYASVFKIPVSFISINLMSILTFGAILLGIYLFIIPIINLLLMLTLSRTSPILQRTLIPVILVAIFGLIQIYLFGIQKWQRWLPFAIMLIVVIFFQFIFPLIAQRDGKYIDKLKAQEETEEQFPDAYVIIRKRFGRESLFIIIVFLVGIFFAENAGAAEAIRQRDFLVTNTTPELVVLRIYGNNMICAPFDRITGEVEPDFTVLRVTGEVGLVLKLEDVGPLHLPTTAPAIIATPSILPSATPSLISTNAVP